MGDSRYYTPEQFFNIMLLTILIIIMVVGFMLCLYKVDRFKHWIRVMGCLLGLSIVGSYIAEIAYSLNSIALFGFISKMTILLYILVCAVFYVSYLISVKEDIQIKIAIILLFIVPTIIYINYPEYKNTTYILHVFNFIVLSNRFTKYRVSASVFSDVKKQMLDFVFIIGINGDVIFKSDKVSNSAFFANVGKINIYNIDEIFNDRVITRNAFGKKLIKLDGEEISYLQYHKKAILDHEDIVGYILTFTDITEFISMLDELSSKQEESSDINNELNLYKEKVYGIEREKEINSLLDEIAKTQQKAMLELKSKIEESKIGDKDFLIKIEELILIAKSDLKNVRDAVTAYVNYYDEGGYDD